MTQAFGLALLLVTSVVLGVLGLMGLARGDLGWRGLAAVVSTLLAATACIAMLLDAADMWLRGRRMTAAALCAHRIFVFVAVLAALLLTFAGRNGSLVVLMLPGVIVYLFVRRAKPAPAAVRSGAGGRGAKAATGPPSAARRLRPQSQVTRPRP